MSNVIPHPILPELMESEDILKYLNISRQTLYRYRKKEGFPEPVRLSRRNLRWRKADVDAWISKHLSSAG